MFKMGSFEEEIYQSMERNLLSSQKENQISKMIKAADYLYAAAEIFKNAGMEEYQEILQMANQLKKNK